MSGAYSALQLRLPYGGPLAHGQLLEEKGTNGSQKFLVRAGSPARPKFVESFPRRARCSYELRERLINDGLLTKSTTWPGYLEVVRDITCNSPTAAAEILLGRSSNGWLEWKTAEGQPLSDYLPSSRPGPNRTWLVRGSNVSGLDLVQSLWLKEGRVSVAASQLRDAVTQDVISKNQLRTFIEEDYGSSLTYNQQIQLAEELYIFLSMMKPGDTVCTFSNGLMYIGEITGAAEQTFSEDGRSNLLRPAQWQSIGYPYHKLPEELQQKLSIQHDIVDLTAVGAVVAGLGRSDQELLDAVEESEGTTTELAVLIARRELELPEPTTELADELLVHDVEWLRELRELLWDDRQLILYGPPGTGKTYLALKLAEFFGGGPEQVKLVQFHPSYAYEDFFEGFRPREDEKTKKVDFRITDGPLRELADLAASEGKRHIPHFLIIDEINRANLAKVFGELYFLLEYRNKSVRLAYSGKDFALPPNLFVIGTMNTADRSIALVDAAMRRRFSFVELSPRIEPTRGLLRRWLTREGRNTDPADLLDALNSSIGDPEFQVGPSYLMKKGVYRDGGLERTWRTKILPLLEEHYYGESVNVEERYGLRSLRATNRSSPEGDTAPS